MEEGKKKKEGKKKFSSKQLSISFSRFYRGNKINRIQNLGQVLCWPREAGSWQLCLQLPEMLARAGSSEVAGGMCSWLSFAASMYGSWILWHWSSWHSHCSQGLRAEPGTGGFSVWKDPVPLLPLLWALGRGFQVFALCSPQHVLLYLKLTFPPPPLHPTHTSQLVEYILKSC